MNNNFLDFYLNEQIQIGLLPFLKSILVVTILCFIIQICYLKFSNSFSNKYLFSRNFIILGLATTIVITIVKSSLALSLGLVGALSIVRFRAAIKDPEELVYLFLIIATGLGCGAGQIQITTIGILISLLLIILFSIFSDKKNNLEILNSSFVFTEKISEDRLDNFIKSIQPHCKKINFISYSSSRDQTTLNLDIIPNNFKSISKIQVQAKKLSNKVQTLFAKDNSIAL